MIKGIVHELNFLFVHFDRPNLLFVSHTLVRVWTVKLLFLWGQKNRKNIYDPGSRFATPPPPPTWYGPKTCVLQHSACKRCIFSVFCMVGCWCGPQPCKFVGFLQPTFRKRVICNVSASTSWSSAAAPSSISVSNYHIILNLLLTVFSLGTGLISVYILCLSNFLLECLVFRNWSNLKCS